MTVTAITPVVSSVGSGNANAISVPYTFDSSSDLEVVEVTTATGEEETLVLNVDYTVSGGSGAAGSVTPAASRASTVSWRIRRVTPRTQAAAFSDAEETPLATLERAVDRLTRQTQDLAEMVGRAVALPPAEWATSTSRHLPLLADRAGKLARYDLAGRLSFHDAAGDLDLSAELLDYDAFLATEGAVSRSMRAKLRDYPDVRDYGATPGSVNTYANNNSAAFALAVAENPDRPVFIPPGHEFRVDDEVVVETDGAGFFGAGDASIVTQITFGLSLFQFRDASFNTCRDMRLVCAGAKANIPGSYLGLPARERAAAVWAKDTAHLVATGLRCKDWVVGVRLLCEDVLNDLALHNRVTDGRFGGCDFGVLSTNQANLLLLGLQGDDTEFTQPSAPPHLVYLGGEEGVDRQSENIVIANCVDNNNPHSSSYKARNARNLLMANLLSNGCPRGADLAGIEDFVVTGGGALDMVQDAAGTDTQRSGINLDGCRRGIITGYVVHIVDNLDTTNGFFLDTCEDVQVVANRVRLSQTSAAGAYTPYRALDCTRVVFRGNEHQQLGANKYPYKITGGDRCKVILPHGRNAGGGRVLLVETGSTNFYAMLDRGLFHNASTSGEVDTTGAGSGCVVCWQGQFLTLPPLAAAPANVAAGTVAYSDGTAGSSGWGGSGAGLYQLRSGSWAFVG